MFEDGRAGPRSQQLFATARACIPGGVNSPVRAFAAVGGAPPFVRRASGCHLVTEDGATLVDYVGSWGPALLGHAHPEVVEAVIRAARDGLSFGAATAGEVALAQLLCEMIPGMRDGMVRLVSSGTEATMSALRLARGFTRRDKIVKCDGGYHGHADMLLVAAGSGAATLGIPGSAGVPGAAVRDTLLVPFNDADAVDAVFATHRDEIAALIVEPVAGNMGCILPRPGYLERLRAACDRHGVVLVFDEVMTGFRVGPAGAQGRWGVIPDLTCLGKIVGGGMPVGAYGGRREIMELVAPLGPVYQAGTLSGNPLSVAAGFTTLEIIRRDAPHAALEQVTARLCEGLAAEAAACDIPWSGAFAGAMFGGFFHPGPVHDYDAAKTSDTRAFARWHAEMLAHGVYLAPSQFEAAFVSTAHDEVAIETTLAAARVAFAALAEQGGRER